MTDLIDKALVSAINDEVNKMTLDEVKAELEMMTAEELAPKLRMAISTLYGKAKKGLIPCGRYGPRHVVFRARSVLAFHIYKERMSVAAA